MEFLKRLFLALIVIGGINWGLVGLLQFDLVAWIFGGSATILARVVYVIVGISALLCLPAVFARDNHERRDEHYERHVA